MPSLRLLERAIFVGDAVTAISRANGAREVESYSGLPAATSGDEQDTLSMPARNTAVALAIFFLVLGVICIGVAIYRIILYKQRRQKHQLRARQDRVDLTAWISGKSSDGDGCGASTTRAPSIYIDISRETCQTTTDSPTTLMPQQQRINHPFAHCYDPRPHRPIYLLPPQRARVRPTLSVITTFDEHNPQDIRSLSSSDSKVRQESRDTLAVPAVNRDAWRMTPPPAYSLSDRHALAMGHRAGRSIGGMRDSSWIQAPPEPSTGGQYA